ncbi:uncharacterized protein LOC143361286 [Halictus rubicundus]|uniref:uncharacterized protein LOC143361286 n=1 Tax=Halictus rubicundus TaxID=77578 RepID=UPI00403609FD
MKTTIRSILFCIAFLAGSIAAQRKRLHCSAERRSDDPEAENLKTILNFVHESPEFRPLALSVILPEFRSSFVDFLLEYASEASIERSGSVFPIYKIRSRDLSSAISRMNRSQITWIIFVDDLYSLYVYAYWQPGLWKSSNQYLIFVTSRRVVERWRNLLKKLWTKYGVYRALIVPLHDDFGCLIRFRPFQIYGEEFGDVEKLCLQSAAIERSEDSFNASSGNPEDLQDGQITLFKSAEECQEVLNENTRLFESFRNLNNHPLNVTVFESLLMGYSYDEQHRLRLSKVDGDVVYSLEKALKCKFHVTFMRKLDFQMDDPFDKSLKEIESGNAEIVITGFFVKVYTRHTQFQFTSSMYEDKLCFLSPDSGLVPKAYMPFMPFEKDLWAVLMVYNLLISLLWCCLRRASLTFRRTKVVGEHSLQAGRSISRSSSRSSDQLNRCLEKLEVGSSKNLEPEEGPPEVIQRQIGSSNRSSFSSQLKKYLEKLEIGSSEDSSSSQLKRDLKEPKAGFSETSQPRKDRSSSSDRWKRHLKELNGSSVTLEPRKGPPEVPQRLLKFSHFVEVLCYPLQKGQSPAQRSLLVGTLFFGLIVNGVYQSCLVSSLSKPFHYPQLQTLEDVVDSGKTLITKYANLKTAFLDDTPVGMKLDQMIHVISSRKRTKDMVAFEKKIAITRYYTMLIGDFAYYDKDGNPLIYVVDECPMNYRVSYVLRSQSPYAERVNFVLLRLNEAGLPAFWFDNIIYQKKIFKMRTKLKNEERKIILTLNHYSLTFLLLLAGLIGATIIFVAEVYVARRGT